MNKIDIVSLKQRCPMPELLSRLGLSKYAKSSCPSPFRADQHPSWGIFQTSNRWMYKDFATGEVGDEIGFLAQLKNMDSRQDFYELLKVYQDIANKKGTHSFVLPVPKPQQARQKPDATGFGPGTYEQLEKLSQLRGISIAGLEYAQEQGVLIFGQWNGFEVYGVTDKSGRVVEIRRLDGLNFPAYGSLGERKSHAIKGSQKGWPVGILEAADCDFLAIAEGVPDFIALHQYVLQEDEMGKVGPVGMLSASCSICEDALPYFKGKHVRIFLHIDEAGIKAADRWQKQLKQAGAREVDFFNFSGFRSPTGQKVKDLCEFNQLGVWGGELFERNVCHE